MIVSVVITKILLLLLLIAETRRRRLGQAPKQSGGGDCATVLFIRDNYIIRITLRVCGLCA